jgi:predicted nucleic acid-binding protein
LEILVSLYQEGRLFASGARIIPLEVYDAVYLELARRRALPLATLDKDLGTAASAVGIHVLGGGT